MVYIVFKSVLPDLMPLFNEKVLLLAGLIYRIMLLFYLNNLYPLFYDYEKFIINLIFFSIDYAIGKRPIRS